MHRSYTDEHYATTGVTRKGIINILYPRAELITNHNQLTPPRLYTSVAFAGIGLLVWENHLYLFSWLAAQEYQIIQSSAVETADHACFPPARTGVSLVERSKIKRRDFII